MVNTMHAEHEALLVAQPHHLLAKGAVGRDVDALITRDDPQEACMIFVLPVRLQPRAWDLCRRYIVEVLWPRGTSDENTAQEEHASEEQPAADGAHSTTDAARAEPVHAPFSQLRAA